MEPTPTLLAAALLVAGGPLLAQAPADAAGTAAERHHDAASGLGDPYLPQLGNAGYDVEHYAIDLRVDPVEHFVRAEVAIRATATDDLASFTLDYHGPEPSAVWIDGRRAEHAREGGELRVTPATPLDAGRAFEVVVHYAGTPAARSDPTVPFTQIGWKTYPGQVYAVSQPSGSATWFPVNDHPSDKAAYSIRITVPKPFVAAANGLLVETVDRGTSTTYAFEATHPMASYLATVAVAEFRVERDEGPDGLPLTYYLPADADDALRARFERTGELIAFLAGRFGPYPFDSFGAVVMAEPFPAALETQTLPVYGRNSASESTQAHELAHQWFGNSVSLATWRDLWLSESFAVYASWLWEEHVEPESSIDARVRGGYPAVRRASFPPVADPTVEQLFGGSVYLKGPFAIHALRLRMGDEAFFRLLRTWCERFRGASASTSDFEALVRELGGDDAAEVLARWLHDPGWPAIPELELEGSAPAERASD